MEDRHQSVLDVGDPIVVQCPSCLFVVVREDNGSQTNVEPAADALSLVRLVCGHFEGEEMMEELSHHNASSPCRLAGPSRLNPQ